MLAGGLRGFGLCRPRQLHGNRAAENPGRCRRHLREFSLRDQGTPGESGGPNCLGERRGSEANDRAKAGIQQGLHNEDFELSMVDGRRTYDLLLDLLDPKLVKFQFQVSTISHGYDAAEYFTKYPGRFFSMHVQGWSAETKKVMPVGQDSLDWKKIFTAAKTGGVKNYFVEMNLGMMKASVPYLHDLQV